MPRANAPANSEAEKKAEEQKSAILTLRTVVAAIAGLSGLALYVELVGGATLWARYFSAHLPVMQTITAQSVDYLLRVGIEALFFPFLIAAAFASFQYVLATTEREESSARVKVKKEKINPKGEEPRHAKLVLAGLAVVAAALTVFIVSDLPWWVRAFLVIGAGGGAFVAYLVAVRTAGVVSLSVVFFVYGALYGAAIEIARDLAIVPRFDVAVILRSDEPKPITGLYLGRSSDNVLVARQTKTATSRPGSQSDSGPKRSLVQRYWQVVLVPNDKVKDLVFGPADQPATLASQRLANRLGKQFNQATKPPAGSKSKK